MSALRIGHEAATAHPYKFAEVVEPVIGTRIAPPPAPEAEAFTSALNGGFG